MKFSRQLLTALLLFWLLPAHAATPNGSMVVAAHPLATKAGLEMLNKGGNAFDAAAATALALGVVEPASSGIGGGGFFLLYIAKENRYVMIDARETSPILAGQGKVYQNISSMDGPAAAGVPGLAAGVDHLTSRYGKLTRQEIVAPAAKLARDGFVVSPRLAGMIRFRSKVFNDTARTIFDKKEGEIIRQPGLAETLDRFALKGRKGFYRGQIAGRLVANIKKDGGLIREADLANYKIKEREPIDFNWQGYRFISASLPSSGGMTLAHILGQIRNDKLKTLDQSNRSHLLIEAMKRAYRDRNRNLGDSDFVEIPNDYLDPERLRELRSSIDMNKATPSYELQGIGEMSGGMDTTHFSIVDQEGNMVSATLSINYPFGSGYVSPATGILLNDEMDDFAVIPGEANAYGLVQGQANGVQPGKRMLSSMTPTFVIGPDRTFIVGTPGGSRIISMVLLASLGFTLNEAQPASWVNSPRFHHQFLPDVVQHEKGAFASETTVELTKRGHQLKQLNRAYGNMHAIMLDHKTGKLTGIADQRGEGKVVSTNKRMK
ncbi:gamma-glutamyltransferase [Pseudomonadota bacterium]